MDQKRLVLAIAISLAIMLGFQYFVAPWLPKTASTPRANGCSSEPLRSITAALIGKRYSVSIPKKVKSSKSAGRERTESGR